MRSELFNEHKGKGIYFITKGERAILINRQILAHTTTKHMHITVFVNMLNSRGKLLLIPEKKALKIC
jgi:hypothetical protein